MVAHTFNFGGTSRWFMWITDKFCLHNELWASYIMRTHLKETWREGDRENTPFLCHSTVWMVGESPFSKFLEFFLVSQRHMREKFQGGGREVCRPSMGWTHMQSYSYTTCQGRWSHHIHAGDEARTPPVAEHHHLWHNWGYSRETMSSNGWVCH